MTEIISPTTSTPINSNEFDALVGYFKKRGSGIFFSCITNEIPMIIPKNCTLWKSFLNKKYKNITIEIAPSPATPLEIDKTYLPAVLPADRKSLTLFINPLVMLTE